MISQPDPTEKLVRDHLLREAAKVDAGKILAAVRARLGRRAWARRIRWGVGLGTTAAAVAVMLLWGWPQGKVAANPEQILSEAQRALTDADLDRCYEIQTRWGSSWRQRYPFLNAPSASILWTRGNHFFVEAQTPDGKSWAWGLDENRQSWRAADPALGQAFEEKELADGLDAVSAIHSVKLHELLGELLTDFNLRLENTGSAETQRIVATPKTPGPDASLRRVRLDVDAKTKVVRQLTLRRFNDNRFAARVTYTLKAEGRIPRERYQLIGHLDRFKKPHGFPPAADPNRFRKDFPKKLPEKKRGV